MDEQQEQDISPLALFYSYAYKDEELRHELEKHLSVLQRQGMISEWHYRKIMPGANRNQIRDDYLTSAEIILLLISPDFLASDDCYHDEMQRALQRHEAGLARGIPLLLRPVNWKQSPFAHLQSLPRNGKPVTTWRNRDLAFVAIAKGIRSVLEQWHAPPGHSSHVPARSTVSVPPLPFVFLSYARKDLSLVERLKDDLRVHGILGWRNHNVLQPGSPDDDEDVHEAIRNASAVILVASPHTRRSRSVKQELRIAEMYQRPVSLFWMQGTQMKEVMPVNWSGLPSFDARQERYAQALQELLQLLGGQRSPSWLSLPARQTTRPLDPPRNPYKGLRAFGIEDAQDFFGRERLIEELLEQVQQRLTTRQQDDAAARLLTVLGPSGSGKSSVVMAGLIPRLKQGALPGSQHWIYLDPMVPGSRPLEALTRFVASLFPERSLKSICEDLDDDSARGLHLLLATCVKKSNTKVLLLIDQFEELFTQLAMEEERRRFLDLLLAAITEPQGLLVVVLTVRADFYDRPLHYPELGRLIEASHVTVYPMETPDVRAVIEQPARLPDVHLTFEEDLVGDLLFDVQGHLGALPLLQFTLDQLFHRREGQLLTMHAYHEIGGVKGALAQHAERTYQSLRTLRHQRLAHALFLRLINPGTVEQDATRRRVVLAELVVIDPKETAMLAEVTQTFIRARLLATNTVSGVPTVEVSHEALIGVWTRLEDWLHEARDDIRLQQAISMDAAEWKRHGQPVDRLYRDSQLSEALAWRKAHLPSLDEDTFLQASVEGLQRVQGVERERHQRYTRRMLLIGMAGVVGMAGTGLLVNRLRGSVSSPPALPPKSLPYRYTGHTSTVNSIAWAPDGKRLASAGDDSTVQVWDASSGSLLFTYKRHTSTVNSIAWAPDGKRLASAGADSTVQVWDASSGSLLFTYKGHTGTVNSVAWAPDGKRLASAGVDRTVQVWDASSGSPLFTYKRHTSTVNSIAWAPDGKRLASGGADSTVQVWDASSGSPLFTYKRHTSTVNSIAWAPDGKRLASAGVARTVQVWDASSGSPLFAYKRHTSTVNSIAWAPDGKRLASGGVARTVQVWDASSGSPLFAYKRHTSTVNSIAWAPDGKRLASAGVARTVQVWDASSGSPLFAYK